MQLNIGDRVYISTFDDGYADYTRYINEWIITNLMFGGGKMALQNVGDNNITIPSISAWKVRRFRII